VTKGDEQLGTELLLKNDCVGVWEHVVPAGKTGHSHTHRRPYVSVIVRGGKGETIAPTGEVLDGFDFTPGAIIWVGPDELPATHALRNTGDEDVAIVTIELF
jgi:hypothetical protein